MKTIVEPEKKNWIELCRRPRMELEFLDGSVRNVLNRVKVSGDRALRELTLQFDKVDIDNLLVTPGEIASSANHISDELKRAIGLAASNIEKFHQSQFRESERIKTMPGVTCWRKAVPIQKVGLYIPGGTAPLFSTVLMLGIPARLAGCEEVILCTPPDRSGKINPAILYAAHLVGVTRIVRVGGAQAIAALAYGTESVPAVSKIFGPGNQYVTKAKQLVTEEGVAIDMPAGPSEVLIFADDTANAEFVAADLLSQAEHGPDSQVMLVASTSRIVETVQQHMNKQLKDLPRKSIAEQAIANSRAVVFSDDRMAMDFINEYAPEHLILNVSKADRIVDEIKNAGSVFIGNLSPEAVGDYASGTNHTLPTNGYAKAYAGVSLESFLKYITFQQLTQEGLELIGPAVETMAEAEQLIAHKNAISIRLQNIRKGK